MKYKAIMACALIMGSMQHAWGMQNSIQEHMERDRLITEGQMRKLSAGELEGSNEEIAKRIEAKKKNSSATAENLIRLRLVAEGFNDGSKHTGD
jgi:hypothetical protein